MKLRALTLRVTVLVCLFVGGVAAPAFAQNIRLKVDASHAGIKYLAAHEEIPVKPGPLTLYTSMI